MNRPYHHGDLANAMTDAAIDLARRGGPEAVVLREAARQVGVSATAAYRHFAGHGELIDAVKECALNGLAEAMEIEMAANPPLTDPVEDAIRRWRALGRGYLTFALTEPGLFRTAYCRSDHDTAGTFVFRMARPYLLLSAVLNDLIELGRLTPERRPFAEFLVWSTVHGLALLLLDGPLRDFPADEREAIIERTLDFCRDGLL